MANEDGAPSPSKTTLGGNGSIPSAEELVHETHFDRVDADYHSHLIPGYSDPEGDRVLEYNLRQKNQYIADVDSQGRLLSDAREYLMAKTVGLLILLRVRYFCSEAEAAEFVYQCHDGGRYYKPADLRKMRHARVMNLLTIPGMFPAEIARRTGMDESTIRKIHNRINPGLNRGDGRRVSADKEARIRQLGEEKIKHTKIAALTGVSKATVSRILKPAPKKVAPKPAAPERKPAADYLVGEPAKAASYVMAVTSNALPEADEVDAFTRSAYAKAGISMDFSSEDLAALDGRVAGAVNELVNKADAEDRLLLFLTESEFYRRAMALLDQKIIELLDEAAERDDRCSLKTMRSDSKKKKSFGTQASLTGSVAFSKRGNHSAGSALGQARSTRFRSRLSSSGTASPTLATPTRSRRRCSSSMGRSTSSSEDRPASPSRSVVSEAEWVTTVANWPSDSLSLLLSQSPDGSCGKTCRASSAAAKDGILEPCSGRWRNSGMGGPTGRLTLNGSESPSDASVCSLLDILETGDVPQRYFLSAKACSGIRERGGRCGKKLPEPMAAVLLAQSHRPSVTPATIRRSTALPKGASSRPILETPSLRTA